MGTLTQAIALLVIFGVSAGLLVGPVRLVNNGRYISYRLGPSPNNSLFECPHVLNLTKNEVLQKISWNFLGKSGNEVIGTYEWTPSDGGTATGVLEGVVNLTRRNGSLELTELRYDLGGYYDCSATLANGQTQKAEKWEALVIDTTSSSLSTKSEVKEGDCVIISSVQVNTIYPEPTVHSGMYSPSREGYYDQVTAQQWLKIIYQNKSVGYSHNNKEFKIDENTPYDAYFLLNVGVTKSDGNYISLYASEATSSLIQQRGCAALKNKANQVETYRDGSRTCRKEYIELFGAPKVIVTCQKGFHSDGDVSSLELTCDLETFQWRSEEEDVSRDDLRCVMGDVHDNDEDDDGDSARVTTGAAILVMTTTLLIRLF